MSWGFLPSITRGILQIFCRHTPQQSELRHRALPASAITLT